MTQLELDSAIALATGEDLDEIQHLGFSLADPDDADFDPEPDDLPPQPLDWDRAELERRSPLLPQRSFMHREAA